MVVAFEKIHAKPISIRSDNMSNASDMSPVTQARATITLGGIFFLRLFALFLLIPVLSLYAVDLAGATPFLIGSALGIYGLTQGLLQIPLGMLSDHIGRKPVIFAGLCLFIAGSVIAAMADHIYLVILGRALQGAGAIAGRAVLFYHPYTIALSAIA